jgi:hypothetical protein
MLAVFCLRLACGLAAAILCLPLREVNPRFYRAHFLSILGLAVGAAAFTWQSADTAIRGLIGGSAALSFLGSPSWSLERAPLARIIAAGTAVTLAASLVLIRTATGSTAGLYLLVIDDLSSAALLGFATTAMLMGHSYLIAPSMSIQPLLRLLSGFFILLVVRLTVAGAGFASWTAEHSLANRNEVTLLLPLRWVIGFVAPAILGLMARQAAKIRSTQSATGILYVVVIFCFLGELIGLLLFRMTGFVF